VQNVLAIDCFSGIIFMLSLIAMEYRSARVVNLILFHECRGSLYRLLHRPNRELDERRRIRMALDVVSFLEELAEFYLASKDLKSTQSEVCAADLKFQDFWNGALIFTLRNGVRSCKISEQAFCG